MPQRPPRRPGPGSDGRKDDLAPPPHGMSPETWRRLDRKTWRLIDAVAVEEMGKAEVARSEVYWIAYAEAIRVLRRLQLLMVQSVEEGDHVARYPRLVSRRLSLVPRLRR